MRRLRFLPALLLILSACSENIIEQSPQYSDKMGSVSIELSTDLRSEIVATKADNEPDVDEFTVEIYKTDANKTRLYNDSFANTKGKVIGLNAGDYRLVAQHGDTLGCGFDKPYYLADVPFTVEGPGETLEATARLGNVKVAVKYDATISAVYSDYYTIVKHKTHKGKSVLFEKGETRNGFIPAGDLILEIWAEGKVYETAPYTYSPNDFVTFTIASDDAEGNLVINITVENPTVENKDITIPAYTEPQGPPSAVVTGFDGGVHQYIEGVPSGDGCKATFVARGGIKNCILTTNSSHLNGKGLPSTIDFAYLTSDLETKLKSFGFGWSEDINGSRTFRYIDFSGVIDYFVNNVKAGAADAVVAGFTLRVVDEVNKTTEVSFSIKSLGITTTLEIEDYNVWATKIISPTATLSRGDMNLFKLQTSVDGTNWTDVDAVPVREGTKHTYASVPVNPETTYYIRSIYNNNPACATTVQKTTEAAAQLGNSGFEDYQLTTTRFTPAGGALGGGSYNRNWYLPYAQGESDPWWACNSMKSMPDGHTGWTSTWCKNFPSSGYVKDAHGGNKAAMLFCINVGDGNTDGSPVGTTYNGEIWLGTADGSGNQATQGHAFTSRPSKLAFWYKYTANGDRNFYIETWIKDAAGNVIATSKETSGQAASGWTRYELPFTYSNLNAKAASIYVWIASSNGTGRVDTSVGFDLGEERVTAHAGCFLTIDDMELIYE